MFPISRTISLKQLAHEERKQQLPGCLKLLSSGPVQLAVARSPAKGVWFCADPLLRLPCFPITLSESPQLGPTHQLLPVPEAAGLGRGKKPAPFRLTCSSSSDFTLQLSCNLPCFASEKTEPQRGSAPTDLSRNWKGPILLQSHLCPPHPHPLTCIAAPGLHECHHSSCSQRMAQGWNSGTIY